MKRWVIILMPFFLLSLSACSQTGREPVLITHTAYEKRLSETTEVRRGGLTPTVSFTLSMTEVKHIRYQVTDGELELERVAVSVGDKVKKGDLLLSFHSEELQGKLAEYQETEKQNRLLIQHYENLQRVDRKTDYQKEIKDLKQEQEVTRVYIRQTRERIRKNRIYAERDGVITRINNDLQKGIFRAGRSLLTETCSSGEYKAEPEEHIKLSKGMTIQAADGDRSYRFRVTGVKTKKSGKRVYFFKPLSDMSGVEEETALTAQWKRKTIPDCLYVKGEAVCGEDGKHFVRRMDDKGYFEVVEVSVGEEIGEYVVITDGLSEGERVRVE